MKKMNLTAISGAALAAVFVLAAAQIPASGQDAKMPAAGQHAKGRRIEGTWLVEVTSRDCQTGAAIFTAPVLTTYLAGGSMLSDPAISPAVLRTGHGVWGHAGGRSFTNTIVLFRFNPVNGAYAGTGTVRRNIELGEDSDTFTANDITESADPQGNPVGTGCATAVGRRLE